MGIMGIMGTVLGIGDTPSICTTAMVDTVRGAGTLITHPATLVGSRGAGNAPSICITTLVGTLREAGALTADHDDRV
jgi:hypothetical protein